MLQTHTIDPQTLDPQLRRCLDVAQAIAQDRPTAHGQPILQAARKAILELLALHQELQQEHDCAHATMTQDGTVLEHATRQIHKLEDSIAALRRDNEELRQQLQDLQRTRLH